MHKQSLTLTKWLLCSCIYYATSDEQTAKPIWQNRIILLRKDTKSKSALGPATKRDPKGFSDGLKVLHILVYYELNPSRAITVVMHYV